MSGALIWLEAHPPSGSTVAGTGSSWLYGDERSTSVTFSLPTRFRALAFRQVLVSVAPDGRRRVVIRVDAQDVWYPTRPPWSYLNGADAPMVISLWLDSNASPTTPATAPERIDVLPDAVAGLRRLVNAMPVSSGGPISCPAESGARFELRIGTHGSSSVDLSGPIPECGGLQLRMGESRSVALVDTGGLLLNAVQSLAGPRSPAALSPLGQPS